MINVTKTYLPAREKLDRYIDRIYKSGWITNNGELLIELEKRLSAYLGVENLVLISNGTLAMQIAYRALEIEGDVITTPFSFVATTSSLVWEHHKPVFADIDGGTFNIDTDLIATEITKNTGAILPVHVFGNGCEVERIDKIARDKNLMVVYDAAHAFGVKHKGKSILLHGDASVLSFHATKIFHTIEGGAIVFRRKKHADAARLLINFGISGYDKIDTLGINAKMNEFQAAMGLCVLDDIDTIISQRKEIWERYHDRLSREGKVTLQNHNGDCTFNYTYFPVVFGSEKNLLESKHKMESLGIFPRRYFYPSLNTLGYLDERVKCTISERTASTILCLPIFPGLEAAAQEKIIRIINETSMIMNSFYQEDELKKIGFKSFGKNVKISRKASVYSPESISIGDNVRVDDFCILSGNISIGSYIHISAYTALYGLNGITLEDFVTISGRVLIYSQNDDYSGHHMTNPMVPAEYTNVTGGPVLIKKHTIIAAGSIILPSVTMGEGSCLGAMSMLKANTEPWWVYAGVPAVKRKERHKDILKYEEELLLNINKSKL